MSEPQILALAWFPHDEWPKAVARWPDIAEGTAFGYIFDLGDMWGHRCEIGEAEPPPAKDLELFERPFAIFGWGTIPDQYGRTTPDE